MYRDVAVVAKPIKEFFKGYSAEQLFTSLNYQGLRINERIGLIEDSLDYKGPPFPAGASFGICVGFLQDIISLSGTMLYFGDRDSKILSIAAGITGIKLLANAGSLLYTWVDSARKRVASQNLEERALS